MNPAPPAPERLLARLTLPAEEDSLTAVLGLVRELAAREGLRPRKVERLAFAVEEAFSHVAETAYPPERPDTADVEVIRRPGKLAVAIQDHGLPFDFQALDQGLQSGLSELLGKAFDGEVHCLSLGRGGNRVELIAALPSTPAAGEVSSAAAVPAPADDPLDIRLMKPDEAGELTRCLYRSYGYSYDADYMYDPERVRELQESGLMRSCVAVNRQGEIVGHLALNMERPDALVGEAAQAIVDPRYRGHGLFEKLKTFLKDDARARGMYGLYSEAVTIHPYSQKGNLHLGAHETGLLLGYIPATVSYKEIKELQQQRQSVMLFYLKINDGPVREVFPPPQHEAMIRNLYNQNGLTRNLKASPGRPAPALQASSQLDLKIRMDHNEAFLRVRSTGQDLEGLVHFRLRELFLKRLDCVYLDLPLSEPAVATAAGRLEALGFFFGGVIPELAGGDVLRLQCLNNLAVDPAQIQVGSEHGKNLLDYVLAAREAAPEVVFH